MLWRLGIEDDKYAEVVEQRIVRFIGWTFLILSAAIVFRSAWALFEQSGAEESLVGIGLALVSVTFMPLVAVWKLRIAAKGNLQSIAIEAKETIACSLLSLTLLVGPGCQRHARLVVAGRRNGPAARTLAPSGGIRRHPR